MKDSLAILMIAKRAAKGRNEDRKERRLATTAASAIVSDDESADSQACPVPSRCLLPAFVADAKGLHNNLQQAS